MFLSFFSSSWCRRLVAVCEGGKGWLQFVSVAYPFRVSKETKCHSCIFSVFLNISLPLVFCINSTKCNTGKRTQRKMKEGGITEELLISVLKNSASALYITCFSLHLFLWKLLKELLKLAISK